MPQEKTRLFTAMNQEGHEPFSAIHDLSPCRAQLTSCWREIQYTPVTPRIFPIGLASGTGAAAPSTTADGTRH
jgi:hypothetical protein